MGMELKKTIVAADHRAQYDECVKKLLSHKEILAHILVHTVDEFKGMNQRVVSTLNRLSEKNFVYRHYINDIVMWGLDKPPLVIARGHRNADQDMMDRVMRNLEKSPGGMTLGEMLDDVYGTNVKIDLLAYNRVKLALKKLTMDGKIIMDNKNGKNKWMIP